MNTYKNDNKTQGQKKDANIRFQKSYSNIRNKYEYSNIRISVDILNDFYCEKIEILENNLPHGDSNHACFPK